MRNRRSQRAIGDPRTPVTGHRYNDDILTSPSDQEFVRAMYPSFAFALDFQPLRDIFMPVDQRASAAKRRGRIAGIFAISLGMLGWFIACAEQAFEKKDYAKPLLLCAALLSVASVVIGLGGILHASAKKNWLKGRFVTERLRQFHFQNLVLRLPSLVDAAKHKDRQPAFILESTRRLAELARSLVVTHADAEFDRVVKEDDDNPNWLLPLPSAGAIELLGSDVDEFVRAYRELRIVHQLNYAWYHLRAPMSLSDYPIRWQERSLGVVALAGTGIIFVANALQAFAIALGVVITIHPWDFIVVMWIAIVALAIRALEEGLQPQREVERYETYRTICRQTLERLDAAPTLYEKYEAMLALERASYDEMRLFLKTNLAARFIL